jgi:hypothetical protein
VVVLDPDIAAVFPTSESVNESQMDEGVQSALEGAARSTRNLDGQLSG